MGKVVKAVVGVGLAVVGAVTGNFQLIIAGVQIAGSALLSPSPKGQTRAAAAATVQIGEGSRIALFGEVATAGSLADAFNYGGKYGTDWEVLKLAVADHRCEGLIGFYVGDQYVTFTGDGAVPGYNGQLMVWWRPGTADQDVPAVLTTNGRADASDRGAGVAYVVVAYKADASDAKKPVWPGGRPRFLWVVRGARCYDARRDSSVGGAGDQRWADPATWAWSDNPIVCRYTWVRGLYACDRVTDPAMLLIGRGLSALEAPPAGVFHRANLCDELVDGAPRYRVSALIESSASFLSVEEQFAASCAGTISQPEGSVEIDPGEARAAVVTITDDDLLVGSTVSWNERMLGVGSSEWVNTVVARYIEPSMKWQEHSAPVRREVADIIADRQPREERIALGYVIDASQAGRVAEVRRRLGRLHGRAEITLPPRFAAIEEGDWIVWHSPRRFGPVAFTFRVEAWGSDAGWRHRLSLRQISASVYSDTAPLDDGSIAIVPPVPPAIGAPAAGSWALTAGYQQGSGMQTPVLIVTGARDDRDARFVRFQYAAVTDAPAVWIDAGVTGPDVQRHEIVVGAKGTYRVAVSYVVNGVQGDALFLEPVTVGAMLYPDGTPVEDRQPAEKGATNSALPSSPFGPGKTVAQALVTLDKIEPITLDLTTAKADIAAAKKADIDQAAIQRQASDALARIGQVLTRLTVEQNGARTMLRDAGFRVDPDTGQVRIYGVDQVADRTNRVEIALDAVTAQISLRATRDYVNEQIALAQLPGQAAALEDIIRRVTSAEVLLNGVTATVALKADATTVTTLAGTVTSVSQTLDALAGVVRTKADSAVVDALGTRTSFVEQTLQTLGPVTGITMTIRQAQLAADKAGEAVLSGVLGADAAAQRQIKAAAEITQQLYTKILDDGAVEAMARLALAARVGAAESGLVEERLTRADAVSSQAKRIDLVTASFTKADSDEAAARLAGDKANADATTTLTAQVASVSQAVADGDRAQADRTDLLTATVTKNRTDLAQADTDEAARRLAGDKANSDALTTLGATVASQAQAIVDGDKAQATRTDQLVATATKAATDGDAAEAAARLAGDKANSDALASLSATVTTQGKAIVDGDKATASLITQVGARLDAFGGTQGVTIEQKFSALVDRTGKLEGSYTLAITAGNRLQGFVLAGSSAAPAKLMFIDTDLAIGTGRIIFDTGTVMKVQGLGFGVSRDLISWLGPSMPIDQCSRANGKLWESTSGDAYFGGSLSAGSLTVPATSSSLAANASAELPRYGSNGRPVRYVASWSYTFRRVKFYNPDNDGLRDFMTEAQRYNATSDDGFEYFGTVTQKQPASTITLKRAFAGGSYEQLKQVSFDTQTLSMSGNAPTPGDAPGSATFTTTIGGGFTIVDPVQTVADRTVQLVLARGFGIIEDGSSQRLSIVSVEE